FFFQAEDGIRAATVTGVQTCALPISFSRVPVYEGTIHNIVGIVFAQDVLQVPDTEAHYRTVDTIMRRDVYFVPESKLVSDLLREIGRASCRERVEDDGVSADRNMKAK